MNFLFSAIIFSSLAISENLEDLKAFYWSSPPDIVVCTNYDANIDIVREAVEYWEGLGEDVGNIYQRECNYSPGNGEIEIYTLDNPRDANNNPNITDNYSIRGLTNLNVYLDSNGSQTNELSRGNIFIRTRNINDSLLYKHEIGHALGYVDSDTTNSVMRGINFL